MASEFIAQVRNSMRLRGYSFSIEKTYLFWIRRFIYFTEMQHPKDVDVGKIGEYLTCLASERHVSVNTQKVVLNSLVYLFQKYLKREVGQILNKLAGRNRLIIKLLYGSGLRVFGCMQLRIQDIDLSHYAGVTSPLDLLP